MYANVIVDISVENLDRTFQYKIPEEMLSEAKVGARVQIPFGKSNRLISGFILEVTDMCKYKESKMKNIAGVLNDKLVMESQMIQLAAFIHETYGGALNEALKTVLPVKQQVKSVEERWLSFAVSKEEANNYLALCQKKHYKAKERLIKAMLESDGPFNAKIARERYQVTSKVMDGLAAEGVISSRSERVFRNPIENTKKQGTDISLNEEQKLALAHFVTDYKNEIRKTYLLHGITGSGKTEVYLQMMREVICHEEQVIVLIPEIALTHQTVERFRKVFGDRVSILNSRMSMGERFDQYERAKMGKVDIVVGPRMALFTPFERLGLIIMDEEHESSYKSDTTPRYHAREVAKYRAKIAGASLVLGSATPSLESYYEAEQGEIEKLELNKRAGQGTLPNVHVVDLREEMKAGNRSVFSRQLQSQMEERLKNKEQIMLFLNRRGYAGFVSCRSCGNVLKCPHCDVSLTEHRGRGMGARAEKLVCHYCGYETAMPNKCPECGSPYVASFGLGTQKVEEMVKKLFPQARVLRMDADTTTGKGGHERVLGAFRQGDADILIGTQMIVKGHDFPNVTLVGVLAADLSLYSNDYRSSERTFQLLMQAAGRAGRGAKPGDVIIQTYNPDHYCVQAVAHHDYREFYDNEMAFRRMLKYPPVWNIMAVIAQSQKPEEAETAADLLVAKAREMKCENCSVIGPAKANLFKKNDWYRYVIYIKSQNLSSLVRIRQQLEDMEIQAYIQFDNNPQSGF